uniref:Uncharacterized protein n=1 Tax=uncultured marine group II/III euryarchaeote SAT1000_07_H02 TaxID=1456555 RepID=A0A075I2H3_9EURY|nr:hypothetical protein [uncultured marine group II/III euryarchaeote SAT1000_07_H02]
MIEDEWEMSQIKSEMVLGSALSMMKELGERRFTSYIQLSSEKLASEYISEHASTWVIDFETLMFDDWIEKWGVERLGILTVAYHEMMGQIRQLQALLICPKCCTIKRKDGETFCDGGKLVVEEVVVSDSMENTIREYCPSCNYVVGEVQYPNSGDLFEFGDEFA